MCHQPPENCAVSARAHPPVLVSLCISAGWLTAVAAGLLFLIRYAMSPGSPSTPPDNWPASSSISRPTELPVLVMFVHPHCPCSRASIAELAVLMRQCHGKLEARVLVLKPAGSPQRWERTDLWDSAAGIPDTLVLADMEGAEAFRFCASTSGDTLLYESGGKLLFHGGITAARGHQGDNGGREGIVALVRGSLTGAHQAPVYGCELFEPDAACKGAIAGQEQPCHR